MLKIQEEKIKEKKKGESREEPALENKRVNGVIFLCYSSGKVFVLLTDRVLLFPLECVCSLVSPDRGSLAFN